MITASDIDMTPMQSLLAMTLGPEFRLLLLDRNDERLKEPDSLLQLHDVVTPQQEVIATLGLQWPAARQQNDEREQFTAQLLDAMATIIATQSRMNSELDSMATELSERYEELNLVYDSEQFLGGDATPDDALPSIVQACIDYLDIDMVMLLLPEKDIAIYSRSEAIDTNSMRMMENIGDPLTRIVRTEKVAVVYNRPEELPCNDFLDNTKVLASPVLTPRGAIDGSLIAIRTQQRQDFSNSDRKLISVVARRVSQILQRNYDALTGVYNRFGLEQQVSNAIETLYRRDQTHCILFIDLDDFHVINDTHSFSVGDHVLCEIAGVIKKTVRDDDIVSRFAGNAFCVLLKNCAESYSEIIADKLCQKIAEHQLPIEGKVTSLTASIGLELAHSNDEQAADILSNAELACDEAKAQGKNRVYSFANNREQLDLRREQVGWVERIKRAIASDAFELYAQPIETVVGGDDEIHLEILLRLRDDDGKLLTPIAFMPAAERYRLMPDVDRWVIKHALSTAARYADRLQNRQVKIAINLSGQTLAEDDLKPYVMDVLAQHQISPTWFCFEITETAAIDNLLHAQTFIQDMREQGVRFSLDDFGTGLSSYEYVKALPIDFIKIDGVFIRSVNTDPVSLAIVQGVQNVAAAMKLRTIAEFVENDQIRAVLKEQNIDYAQGYGIAKPAPLDETLEALLSNGQ